MIKMSQTLSIQVTVTAKKYNATFCYCHIKKLATYLLKFVSLISNLK